MYILLYAPSSIKYLFTVLSASYIFLKPKTAGTVSYPRTTARTMRLLLLFNSNSKPLKIINSLKLNVHFH